MQLQSFCRFITSNTTSCLQIPSLFTRDHREHILLNNVVVLVVSDDISWDISLTVSSDGKLWLQKGWPEFAKLYGLKFGYMLLFNHLGKSVFQVRIFDPACCEINYSQVMKVPKHVMTQELYQCLTQDGDDDHVMAASTKKRSRESGQEESFFKIILRDSDDFISLSSSFTKKYMEKSNKTQTVVIKTNSSTTEWNVKYLMIDGKYYFMDGWLKFMKDNGVRFGDLLVFWLVSHSPTVFNVFIYASNTCLKNQSSCSANIDPATPKVCNGEEGASASGDEKETPFIKKSMSKTIREAYIHYIPLTKEFENTTGIGDYGSLLLKNKEGKKWEVDIKRYNNYKQQLLHIRKGWTKFVRDNKIEVGDKCKFKHVKGKLVRVHVFRKNGRPLGNKSNCD